MSLTTMDEWNETLSMIGLNSTTMLPNVVLNPTKRHVTFVSQVVLTLVYITGVIGNVSALVILFHRDKVILALREINKINTTNTRGGI